MKKLIYFGMGLLLRLSATLWTGCKDKEEEPGAVYGVITDKATGEPVKNAGVELQPIGLKTVTGTDGQYRFDELEPGTYKLYVTKTGYADLLSNEIVVKSGQTARCDVQLAQALRIVNDKAEDICELDFGAEANDVQRSFNIFNDGIQTLQWKIIASADWITKVSMWNGSLLPSESQNITVAIDRGKLKFGDNVTTLYITSIEGDCQMQLKAQEDRILPVLNTLEVTEISTTTATMNGQITDVGQPAYTERGFVYSTSSLPTVENAIRKLPVAVNDEPTFSTTVTGLTGGEGYYVRAYAVNEKGVAYSANEVHFVVNDVFVIESLNLMVQTADMSGEFTWGQASVVCAQSTVGGYTDWRLPTEEELVGLCERKTEIGGFGQEVYWAETIRDDGNSDFHKLVNFSEGENCFQGWARYDYKYRARAVRTITE